MPILNALEFDIHKYITFIYKCTKNTCKFLTSF